MNITVIVGVSGGMGLKTAQTFIEKGHKVFGLDINKPSEEVPNLEFLQCDVRDYKSIEKCFNNLKKQIDHIDNLVILSGIYDLNSLVEISEDDFTKIFDINLFGPYRINKIFLPLLKKNSKIIIISSELAPLDPLPFTGLYGITKAALEKYAYSLRMELQLLGIQVVVVRPGAVETKLLDISNARVASFASSTTLYKQNANNYKDIVESVESKKIKPIKIASLIYKITNKKKPKYVYNINRNFGLRMLNHLPDRFQTWIIKKILTK